MPSIWIFKILIIYVAGAGMFISMIGVCQEPPWNTSCLLSKSQENKAYAVPVMFNML
jgi:hypothetical protein